jgi:hypothetical protein
VSSEKSEKSEKSNPESPFSVVIFWWFSILFLNLQPWNPRQRKSLHLGMQGVPLFSWIDHIDLLEMKILKGNVDRAGHGGRIRGFELKAVSVA